MKQRMWAYLMHLGDNMWADPGANRTTALYYPELSLDEKVWKKTIDYLPTQGINTILIDVGDAIQYETHPEIATKGAWTKERLKKELDHMRAIGLTPLPKLNFSAGHDAWLKDYSRMVSTPQYYQVCKDLILELIELFDNPEYFHLGLDEENMAWQGTLAYCVIRNGDLWWHDAYYLFDICEKAGVRPWVWSDYCWHHPQEFVKKMPKSVLQSNWWYNKIRKNPDGSYQKVQFASYGLLEEAGFDQVPCCGTFEGFQNSAHDTMRLGKEDIAPERVLGYMTAPWRSPRTHELLSLMNDAYRFGVAKKQFYPEECK